MQHRGKPYPLAGYLPPPRNHPWGTLSMPWSPGMKDLAWHGDKDHEPGSLELLRYQIRPLLSLLHAVLALLE